MLMFSLPPLLAALIIGRLAAEERSIVPDGTASVVRVNVAWDAARDRLPWIDAHAVDMSKRPGKRVTSVVNCGSEGNGDLYLKSMIQVLGRGVQGIGVEGAFGAEDASAVKVGNMLAKMYGPIFADCRPANEGAILFSKSQEAAEARKNFGSPHWGRTYALYCAGLMAGVPMSVTFEEDVEAGWLLEAGKPRVPMLFLAGQSVALPDATKAALEQFVLAGGRIFTDAESAPCRGATALDIKPGEIIEPLAKSYGSDAAYPMLAPILEKLAQQLKAAVGALRRFPMDTDDPWISKNHFDGGAVQYVLLANETSKYSWDAGIVWELGTMFNANLPKTAAFTWPKTDGVVYDVFDQKLVTEKAPIQADMTVFPGRLYAIAPKAFGAPKLVVQQSANSNCVTYSLNAADEAGQPVDARAPVRIEVLRDGRVICEEWRSTVLLNDESRYRICIAAGGAAKIRATCLLGGKASEADLGEIPAGTILVPRPDAAGIDLTVKQSASKSIGGTAVVVASIPKLSDFCGIRLSSCVVSSRSNRILVTAGGYAKNLALIEDKGDHAEIVRAERVGQAESVYAPFINSDGARFGAAGREVSAFGQGFHLFNPGDKSAEIFAAFGDMGGARFDFAASDDGNTVLAPGTYGVVCWTRRDNEWREAWAIDYWKKYGELDWPVESGSERIPSFDTVIPMGADYALIAFNEFGRGHSGNAPGRNGQSYLAALNLSDGKERWRFEVPDSKGLAHSQLVTSADGEHILLCAQLGNRETESFRFYRIEDGKALGAWNSKTRPNVITVANEAGWSASAYNELLPRIDLRRRDGSLIWTRAWTRGVVSLAFSGDGEALFVADDSGTVTRIDSGGESVWSAAVRCVSHLGVRGERVYAAGWDGRLRCMDATGKIVWTLDCTAALNDAHPMAALVEHAKNAGVTMIQASRPPTTSTKVPKGENLLRSGTATLRLGGAEGGFAIQAGVLTNGTFDDVETPWLGLPELFACTHSGQHAFAEISFAAPTDVHSLTVYENNNHPEAWPREGCVQVWDERAQAWVTAARGVFLLGAVNTYSLHLTRVSRLRYVPWGGFRNYYACEIEVR